MRILIAAGLLVAAGFVAPAQAQQSQYPWCSGTQVFQGQQHYCGHRNFEACRQEITGGNRGWCYPNPRYAGRAEYDDERLRRRRGSHY